MLKPPSSMRAKFLPIAASFGTFLRFGPALTESSNSKINGNTGDDKLVGVQVIYRHGARTPVYTIPVSTNIIPKTEWDAEMTSNVEHTVVPFTLVDLEGRPTTNDSKYVGKYLSHSTLPGGSCSGHLTRLGQEDMYRLGQRLRQRYVTNMGFISDKFDPHQVYSRSTRYPRNVKSTRCLLAGMFGREAEGLKIHISTFDEEILSPNRNTCQFVSDSLANFVIEDFPMGMLKAREKALRLFGPNALTYSKTQPDGSKKAVPSRLHCIRDELICRIYHGLPVPDEVYQFAMELNSICPLEMARSENGHPEGWRAVGFSAAAGRFCQEILDNLSDHAESRSTRMRLYATHDDMLITLLLILDLFDGEWPPFSSDIIIELYEKNSGGHRVRVLYCDKLIAEKSLQEFQQQLEKVAVTVDQHREICSRGR